MSKIFTSLIIASAIFQIVFSFFYSNNILAQNNQLNQHQTQISQLKLDIELIEKNMADNSSIKNINSKAVNNKTNINKTIKINY